MAKPFLKWAGGKRSVLPVLLKAAPEQIETYYEPFLGGGALFFALQAEGRFKHAVLSDSNEELINAYIQVRDAPDALVIALAVYQRKYRELDREHRASFYYTIRAKNPTCDVGRAARLIFLNKTCYNGLYRVNSRGEFNVPHGRYANPTICDQVNLQAASKALQGADLKVADFAEAVVKAHEGDFAYFDPPYFPLSETANFTSYTDGQFGWGAQQRLARIAYGVVHRGGTFALSNAGTDEPRRIYERYGFNTATASAVRLINADSSGRGEVTEHLVTGGPNKAMGHLNSRVRHRLRVRDRNRTAARGQAPGIR